LERWHQELKRIPAGFTALLLGEKVRPLPLSEFSLALFSTPQNALYATIALFPYLDLTRAPVWIAPVYGPIRGRLADRPDIAVKTPASLSLTRWFATAERAIHIPQGNHGAELAV
jgi:hypothetical protein